MKGSEQLKSVIKAYLDKMAEDDNLFANKYANPNKKLDDCITYILNSVKNSGINGFADDEIYGMAVHYYEEENIDPGKPMTNGHVVVNHHVELTEEEKEEIRKKAREKVFADQVAAMHKKPVKKQQPVVNAPITTEVDDEDDDIEDEEGEEERTDELPKVKQEPKPAPKPTGPVQASLF